MYITIRPSDLDRHASKRIHADFIDFLKQFYVGYSYEMNIWRLEEPNWEATMDSCKRGWRKLEYSSGYYDWFTNIYLLLNVPDESELFKFIRDNGDTTFEELYDWFEETFMQPKFVSTKLILIDFTTGETKIIE